MNDKELANELIKWLPKLVAGKTLCAHGESGQQLAINIKTVEQLTIAIEARWEIRIQQTPIPNPPDGQQWQNPDNLTAEQIGIDDGWRLLLKSEVDPQGNFACCQPWIWDDHQGGGHWIELQWKACESDTTYRVKADQYPVGSLKPRSEAAATPDKRADIAMYLRSSVGLYPALADLIAGLLITGMVPHVELKK